MERGRMFMERLCGCGRKYSSDPCVVMHAGVKLYMMNRKIALAVKSNTACRILLLKIRIEWTMLCVAWQRVYAP